MFLIILLLIQRLSYIEPSIPSPAINTPLISASEQYYNRLYNHITSVPLLVPVASDVLNTPTAIQGAALQEGITTPSLKPSITSNKNTLLPTYNPLFNTGQSMQNTINFTPNESPGIPLNYFGIYPQLVQQYNAVDHLLPQNIVAVQPIGVEQAPLAAIVQLNDGRHVLVLLPQNETTTAEPAEVTTNSIEKDAELISMNTKEKLVKAEVKVNNEYIPKGIERLPLENEINTNLNKVNFNLANSPNINMGPYNNQRQNRYYNRRPNQVQGLMPPPLRYVLQDYNSNKFLLRKKIRDIEITTFRPFEFFVARPPRSSF